MSQPADPVRLTPFRAAHALALRPSAPGAEALSLLGDLEARARAYEAAGPAWTLWADGRPLACGGAVRFWPGVGELWCWAGDEASARPVAFARQARRCVALLRGGHGFARVQAHVREDDARARRFALFLGLLPEGRCPGYGPNHETHLLYGRYTPWKA